MLCLSKRSQICGKTSLKHSLHTFFFHRNETFIVETIDACFDYERKKDLNKEWNTMRKTLVYIGWYRTGWLSPFTVPLMLIVIMYELVDLHLRLLSKRRKPCQTISLFQRARMNSEKPNRIYDEKGFIILWQ